MLRVKALNNLQQECIPVGCVPPASMVISTGRCLPGRGGGEVACLEGVSHCRLGYTPPCGQTDACENITLPVLRLRAVISCEFVQVFNFNASWPGIRTKLYNSYTLGVDPFGTELYCAAVKHELELIYGSNI